MRVRMRVRENVSERKRNRIMDILRAATKGEEKQRCREEPSKETRGKNLNAMHDISHRGEHAESTCKSDEATPRTVEAGHNKKMNSQQASGKLHGKPVR